MRDKFLVYLKGVLMGICDLIPGISGGTVAFITGIYARLIDAVKAFSLKFFKNLLLYPFNKNGELKGDIRRLDLGFLLILFLLLLLIVEEWI